jgi:hypothetical protein
MRLLGTYKTIGRTDVNVTPNCATRWPCAIRSALGYQHSCSHLFRASGTIPSPKPCRLVYDIKGSMVSGANVRRIMFADTLVLTMSRIRTRLP